jgi:DNA-binding winged helix-turn-helix (wHTH) protein
MRIKYAFNSVFTKQLMEKPAMAKILLTIFFIASSFTAHADRDLWAKKVNLLIRQTGHRLLLQAGDSSSRVLPVTEVKEGTFLLRFANELVFNHDSLTELTRGLFPKTQFPAGYTVTVHDCMKGGIVYGFQVNNTSPDILACSGRSQPSGCYTIEFTFPNLYGNVKEQKADIRPLAASVKADPQVGNPTHEALATVEEEANQRTEAPKSLEPISKIVNRKVEASNKTTFNYPSINVIFGGILLLVSGTILLVFFRKYSKQEPRHAIIKEPISDLAALGNFLFNVKGQRLLLGSEVITLTDKECKVLELLYKNFGKLIPRETLMQEVWINEGVFTGRSLDMFVSKLRKKLSHDPELRITNVHGQGYKLEKPEKLVT